jgi:hypothetical protein
VACWQPVGPPWSRQLKIAVSMCSLPIG